MPSITSIIAQIAANMVFIPGGTFGLGEKKNHQVTIGDFYLNRYPVTVEEYLTFMEATNSNHPKWMEDGSNYNIYTGSDEHYKKLGSAITNSHHPMVGISWDNATAFCAWLRETTGENYQLPSQTQWE